MKALYLGFFLLYSLSAAADDAAMTCSAIQTLFHADSSIVINGTDFLVCDHTPVSQCHSVANGGTEYSFTDYGDAFKGLIQAAEGFGCSFGGAAIADGGAPNMPLSDTQKLCVAKSLALWNARYYDPKNLPLNELIANASKSPDDFKKFCASKLGTYHSPDKFNLVDFIGDAMDAAKSATNAVTNVAVLAVSTVVAKPLQAVGILKPDSSASAQSTDP